MNNVQIFDGPTQLAEAAAKQTVETLRKAIEDNGRATWVLAGGSTPMLAYKVIADNYTDALDWSKVAVVIGDERIGANNGSDNNWHAINQIIGKLPTQKVSPNSDQSAEDAAAEYEVQLSTLPKGDNGTPRLDLVWLGVGTDGHTLSLFPAHASLLPSGGLVTAVHDSPKPPADRISLTLRAMTGATNVMIMATGADKKEAVQKALNGDHSPIALVATIVSTHEGEVAWLVDKNIVAL